MRVCATAKKRKLKATALQRPTGYIFLSYRLRILVSTFVGLFILHKAQVRAFARHGVYYVLVVGMSERRYAPCIDFLIFLYS